MHIVWFVKFDLEEKGRTKIVWRRGSVYPLCIVRTGRFCDVCADDEPFYRLSFPFSRFSAGVSEILNFLDAVKDYGGSMMKPHSSAKASTISMESVSNSLGAYVETV